MPVFVFDILLGFKSNTCNYSKCMLSNRSLWGYFFVFSFKLAYNPISRGARSHVPQKIHSPIIPTFEKCCPLGGRSILNLTLFRHLHLMVYMGLIVPLNRFTMTMDLDLSRLVFWISDASQQKNIIILGSFSHAEIEFVLMFIKIKN